MKFRKTSYVIFILFCFMIIRLILERNMDYYACYVRANEITIKSSARCKRVRHHPPDCPSTYGLVNVKMPEDGIIIASSADISSATCEGYWGNPTYIYDKKGNYIKKTEVSPY